MFKASNGGVLGSVMRLALAATSFLSISGCAPFYFYHPALVEGAVVSAVTGQPVSGARVSFQNRAGDPISGAPIVLTAEDGSFVAGDRESRTLVGLEMMQAIESKFPVTLRIEADGYEPRLRDVEGRKKFRKPIELVPVDAATR